MNYISVLFLGCGEKRMSRVESLKNLILHGKTQATANNTVAGDHQQHPPGADGFPGFHCSCRHTKG